MLHVDTMGFWAPHVREAVEVFGADRVMFGTDYGPVPIDPKEHIDIVNALAISEADKEKILWRNAASVFQSGRRPGRNVARSADDLNAQPHRPRLPVRAPEAPCGRPVRGVVAGAHGGAPVPPQSTVTLAVLITAAHFATSPGSMAATSAGVLSATGRPCFAMLARTVSFDSAAATAR